MSIFKRFLNLQLLKKNNSKEIDFRELLHREKVELDTLGISEYIGDKRVLVTGGAGSIGSELCRQIANFRPKKLLILDIYENSSYELQIELEKKFPYLDFKIIIASITDMERVENIFKFFTPEVVFHAAAFKHVPLMEDNPTEAVKNNIFGTLNLIECADKFNIKKFVLISTDKAVNPTSVMGVTKRVCEILVQTYDRVSATEFVAVRFGNVLGSNGSVIPIFKRQIEEGGPVTITHSDITRYFMLIDEAVQLVLQAGAFAKGGEIFILDMGNPIKIYDLACDFIRLLGLVPEKDIHIEVVGLRPGEKLYEELLMKEEGLKETNHEKIFVSKAEQRNIEDIKDKLMELKKCTEWGQEENLLIKLKELVPNYTLSHNCESNLR